MTPINYRGLGIQKTGGKNFALLASLNWRFKKIKNHLWAKFLNKYQNRNQMHNMKCYPYDYYIWKILVKVYPLLYKGITQNVGNGNNTRIWEYNWIETTCSLRQTIQGPLNRNESNLLLNELLTDNNWNVSCLSLVFPSKVKQYIENTYIQTHSHKTNTFFWNNSNDSLFNTKSAYAMYLQTIFEPTISMNYKNIWIWKTNIIKKIKFFQ